MGPKTTSGYFVNYFIGSRGSRFFCPSHTTIIVESDRAVYFGFYDSNGLREPQFRKESVFIPNVIVPDRVVFDLVVNEPIVGHNDLVVDVQDI